ncbi:MAG: sigma-70 family RNA polymerase sigma factor [Verrucomicrobia bacterium]|nr:sigma-70 family RNA polymerase sigma factor [Verrucomicrobiota bacterium]
MIDEKHIEPPDEFLPTRRSLLTRLKNWDDQEGWRVFFDTYWKLIYSVALQAGLSHTEAEDVVQETVLGVAKKMRGFRYDPAIGSFKAWLLLNVRSRIADHLRKKASAKATLIRPAPATGTGTSFLERAPDPALPQLDALWEAEWQRHSLETALERVKARVSAKQYLIFDLYALKQTPIGKITRSLGVSLGQVYLAKHRVARALREEMRKLERAKDGVWPEGE